MSGDPQKAKAGAKPGATENDSAAAVRSRRLLLISALLAAAGVALLMTYLRRFEVETSGGQRVRLLAAITPIPRGTVLTGDMLGVREVPMSYVEPRAVKAAELSKVRGIRTGIDLDPQDSLLWTDLAIAVENRDLSSLVQPGNRALTIEARQGVSSTGGTTMIRPGDYVDVLATFSERYQSAQAGATKVLLQRVLVLAVGSETQRQAFYEGTEEDKRRSHRHGSALTLSLQLEEAQLVSLAAQQGTLSVLLRNAADPTIEEGVPSLTGSNLVDSADRVNKRRAARFADQGPVRVTAESRRR